MGAIYEYLGMTLDFSSADKVMFTMHDYISNIFSELPTEWVIGQATTPAADYLFNTDPDTENLSEEDEISVHHNVAKLLFMSMRARVDIQPTVAFIYKRVRKLGSG